MFLKKIILILIFSVLFLPRVYAEVYLDSRIDDSRTLIPEESPYIIDGEVVIGKKGFLTINPGAVLKFKEGAEITVKGALYSRGTPKNPVRMLPFDGESFYKGIRFESSYKNTVEFTVIIRGALVSRGSPVVINNNYILNSTGVEIFHFGKAVIKNNYFYNNTYGVYIEGKNIKYNIYGNTFNKCRYGVYVKELINGSGRAKKNNFFTNEVCVANYTPHNLDFRNNYWGVTGEKRIQKKIFDKRHNKRLGKVIYLPYSKRKLRLFEPPAAYVSLVKIYLKLKRPDKQPTKVGVGAGFTGFMPLTPGELSGIEGYGTGLSAEATFNITGAFLLGVEGKMSRFGGAADGGYDFSMSLTQFMVNFYAYIGWKKRIYFVPYVKIGNGLSLVSSVYEAGEPLFDGEKTKKENAVCYSAHAGAGLEWFLSRFFSLKAEAVYNYTFYEKGNISYPNINLSGNIYFDAPFFLNFEQHGQSGP